MVQRLLTPSKNYSFFLFGARATGKSTFLKSWLEHQPHWYLDLLDDFYFRRYGSFPERLERDLLDQYTQHTKHIKKRKSQTDFWVIIDEIQRVPELLNSVHRLLHRLSLSAEYKIHFAITSSSARKLKRGQANLLAGRAFSYSMFPFCSLELGSNFDLEKTLHWGGLPALIHLKTEEEKKLYLQSYSNTYIKEELLQEQIIRQELPFRHFLEIAAQSNGQQLNYSKIARDVGCDTKTVQNYYQILEDTLLGFYLPAFHLSARKSAGLRPKFYLFDTGVTRSLEHALSQPLRPGTSRYGLAFEQFVILEVFKLNHYKSLDFQLYHYHTHSGAESDLIMTRGQEVWAIEIKSTTHLDEKEVMKFKRAWSGVVPVKRAFFLSQDPHTQRIDNIECWPWFKFISYLNKLGSQ